MTDPLRAALTYIIDQYEQNTLTRADILDAAAALARPVPDSLDRCPIDGQPALTLSGNCGHSWASRLRDQGSLEVPNQDEGGVPFWPAKKENS